MSASTSTHPNAAIPPTKPDIGLPVVAVVGAGQLARMMHQAAIALGQSLRILAQKPDEAAALVASDVHYGSHTDLVALQAVAAGAHALTFDHEHVPTQHLKTLASQGIPVYPGPHALLFAQDKLAMRNRLTELDAAQPIWETVDSGPSLSAFGERVGWPIIVKTPRGGYDGKGIWQLNSPNEAHALAQDLLSDHSVLLAEERVPLVRELAVQVARSPYGQIAVWPVVETVQRDGVCVEVIAPATDLSPDRVAEVQQLAIRIATELDVVGMLAVELFDLGNAIYVNELAMRPHNSGHWTIEGARTSQFEQHLRAVLDYPLGETTMTAPAVVMANILAAGTSETNQTTLDERLHHMFAADPGVKVHLYGKEFRPGRKIGHVTVLAEANMDPHDQSALASLRERAQRAAAFLAGE